jgi:hypothetical protein
MIGDICKNSHQDVNFQFAMGAEKAIFIEADSIAVVCLCVDTVENKLHVGLLVYDQDFVVLRSVRIFGEKKLDLPKRTIISISFNLPTQKTRAVAGFQGIVREYRVLAYQKLGRSIIASRKG